MTRPDLRHVAKRGLAAGDRLLPGRDGTTILIYHRVGGGSGGAVDLDVDVFRRQLAHLAEHHRVISLDAAVAELAGEGPAAPAVVITFDDGTDDFAEHAVPALVEAGLPATLYVVTANVDTGETFPWGAPPTTWPALRDAVDTGLVTIGSHTHTHALLDRAPDEVIADELDRSIELIGSHLGTEPAHFAYPKAVAGSESADRAVRERFASAVLARNRVNVPGAADPHRLWRTPVHRADDAATFARKAAGGHRLEGEARELLGRIRYRHASR